MGDTPVSLTSPDDRSMLLYSRKVKDKKDWSRTFNLGMEQRGNDEAEAAYPLLAA